MATSRSWASRVGGYLGSSRNIAGCVAGMAALAATVPTGVAGPLWPVVVGGVYGVAALLSPRERIHLGDGGYSAAVARAEQLRDDLARLDRDVHRHDRRLPDDVLAAYDRISESVAGILSRAEQLATAPDDLYVVGRTITEYLPRSLEAYANLPRGYALTRRGQGRRTAHEELLAQLELLTDRLAEIADAIHAGDAGRLAAQGRFLEDKFRRSGLDLPGSPGPPTL